MKLNFKTNPDEYLPYISEVKEEMIMKKIRELREIYGPVTDFRIKRQLARTRKYCRTVKPE